jgi:hypothetical protein
MQHLKDWPRRVSERRRGRKNSPKTATALVAYQAPQEADQGVETKVETKSHPDLKVLAQVAVNMQGEKSDAH